MLKIKAERNLPTIVQRKRWKRMHTIFVYLHTLFPTFSSSSLHYWWQISFVLFLYMSSTFFEIGCYSKVQICFGEIILLLIIFTFIEKIITGLDTIIETDTANFVNLLIYEWNKLLLFYILFGLFTMLLCQTRNS